MPRETPNEDRNARGKFAEGNRIGPRFKEAPTTPAALANRFKKGDPRAKAAGRKGAKIAAKLKDLRKALEDAVEEIDVTDMTKAVIKKAKEGDVFAFREVMDRTIGKTTQTMDIKSDGKPIKGFVGVDVEDV